jgi:hypothetical protein
LAAADVRFTPKSRIHCGSRNVCFVPRADIQAAFGYY